MSCCWTRRIARARRRGPVRCAGERRRWRYGRAAESEARRPERHRGASTDLPPDWSTRGLAGDTPDLVQRRHACPRRRTPSSRIVTFPADTASASISRVEARDHRRIRRSSASPRRGRCGRGSRCRRTRGHPTARTACSPDSSGTPMSAAPACRRRLRASLQSRRASRWATKQLIEVARMPASMSMSRQALDGRCCRLSVQRRQDQVAGHRRSKRDLRRLLVTDLADQEHVRVRAEDRAQAAGERESGARVDLDLVEPFDAVLDGILDRRQLPVRRVESWRQREERRRLARARGADDDDGAERLLDRCAGVRRGCAADMPSASSEAGPRPCESIRSVTFSPYVVGRSPCGRPPTRAPRRIETRPSCGSRRSAMSRPPMILSRLTTAAPVRAAIEGARA